MPNLLQLLNRTKKRGTSTFLQQSGRWNRLRSKLSPSSDPLLLQSEQLFLSQYKRRNARLPPPPIEKKEIEENSSVVPYFNGDQIWLDMWESIRNGKEQILMSTFIIEDDLIGQRTIRELTEAAKRGCHVIFLYDYFGSLMVNENLFKELRESGGLVIEFQNIPKSWLRFISTFKWQSPLTRVHQKMLVVDGHVGYCGGLNIGRDYASESIGGTGRFKDIHCKISGPAVRSLEDTFFQTLKLNPDDSVSPQADNENPLMLGSKLGRIRRYKDLFFGNGRTWKISVSSRFSKMNTYLTNRRKRNKELLTKFSSSVRTPKRYFQYPLKLYQNSKKVSQRVKNSRSNIVQILQSYHLPHYSKFDIQKAYLSAIKNAKHSIRICTPYFMPPPPVEALLCEAVLRGVDVQILTQGKSDRPIMFFAAQHAYFQYIQNGIRIYEMHDNELHAKTIEIDGQYATIGSDNLDHISWGYNAEAKVEIFDKSVAQKLRENFRSCVSAGREIDLHYMNSRGTMLKLLSLFAYKGYHMIYPWKRLSHLE